MPKINVLPKDIAELIAAGEVIERPASVIKELVENSIDADAKHITVEIKNGGITFIRVTDDGCGIASDDVKNAFLRHATSKIAEKCDLDSILTLGFRGEALASICAVAKVEILTKRKEDEYGTHYCIEGGVETLFEETSCPDGTTIIIRDIFYNVPARQKFLKKDSTEANYISATVNKQILSHPEVSIRLIKNNKKDVFSSGDSKLISAIYAVYGRAFASELIEVAPYVSDGIEVSGYAVKPIAAKSTRGFQNFFINGRYVRSVTCACALEEAYKNLVMTQKFPACVLFLKIDPQTVDVNVHPAKAEVRFSDEKCVFNAVYFAVKNALMLNKLHYDLDIDKTKRNIDFKAQPEPEYKQTQLVFNAPSEDIKTKTDISETCTVEVSSNVDIAETTEQTEKISENIENVVKSDTKILPPLPDVMPQITPQTPKFSEYTSPAKSYGNSPVIKIEDDEEEVSEQINTENKFKYINTQSFEKSKVSEQPVSDAKQSDVRVIGEAFRNYILVESDDELIIIDKHAAHERIIFEKLKNQTLSGEGQMVLVSAGVMLSEDEITALKDNENAVNALGFELDYSQAPLVMPKKIPMMLDRRDIDEILPQMAQKLMNNSTSANPDIIDDILHTMACKSAVKQGDINDIAELEKIAVEVINNNEIRHCPHGRPVMFSMPKSKIERQFKR